jgi:hypothetical protein
MTNMPHRRVHGNTRKCGPTGLPHGPKAAGPSIRRTSAVGERSPGGRKVCKRLPRQVPPDHLIGLVNEVLMHLGDHCFLNGVGQLCPQQAEKTGSRHQHDAIDVALAYSHLERCDYLPGKACRLVLSSVKDAPRTVSNQIALVQMSLRVRQGARKLQRSVQTACVIETGLALIGDHDSHVHDTSPKLQGPPAHTSPRSTLARGAPPFQARFLLIRKSRAAGVCRALAVCPRLRASGGTHRGHSAATWPAQHARQGILCRGKCGCGRDASLCSICEHRGLLF